MQLGPADARQELFDADITSPLAAAKRQGTASRRALSLIRKSFRETEPGSPQSLQSPLEALREAIEAQAAVLYVPELTSRGWELSVCHWAGPRALEHSQLLRRFVRSAGLRGAAFGAFDPFAVERDQRDRVFSGAELEANGRTMLRGRRLRSALGWHDYDQLRVLICDGLRLVAWLGVLRRQPFGPTEINLFKYAAKPFSERVKREHARSRCSAHQLVDALLDRCHEPAFVLSQHGRIEHANRAALAWAERPDSTRELATLRAAVAARSARHPTFGLQPLARSDGTAFVLALRVETRIASDDVISRACERFDLQARERRVLQELCAGRSNKEIAATLGVSEVTVERTLTRLYQITCCHGRTELLARIFSF